jgi:hypothetical protein
MVDKFIIPCMNVIGINSRNIFYIVEIYKERGKQDEKNKT